MNNFVVTVARGFGTGGKLIASKLAEELGIHCYENRILTLASQLSGLDRDVFAEVNEKLRSSKGGFASLMKGLPRAKKYIARNEKFVSDDALFDYQKQIKKPPFLVKLIVSQFPIAVNEFYRNLSSFYKDLTGFSYREKHRFKYKKSGFSPLLLYRVLLLLVSDNKPFDFSKHIGNFVFVR